MTAQNQRDPDGTDILGQVRDGLADLKANVISRWGRVPHVASDPATPPDGAVWIRSDDRNLRRRANGVTLGGVARWDITNAAAQTLATATITDVTWDTENADTDNFHAAGSAVVTIPAGLGGVYVVSYSLRSNGWIGGEYTSWILPTSPVARYGYNDFVPTAGSAVPFGTTATAVLALAAGDTVRVQVFQSSGGPQTINASVALCSFSGVKVA